MINASDSIDPIHPLAQSSGTFFVAIRKASDDSTYPNGSSIQSLCRPCNLDGLQALANDGQQYESLWLIYTEALPFSHLGIVKIERIIDRSYSDNTHDIFMFTSNNRTYRAHENGFALHEPDNIVWAGNGEINNISPWV